MSCSRKHNDRYLVHSNVYFVPKDSAFNKQSAIDAQFIINAIAFLFIVVVMAGCMVASVG